MGTVRVREDDHCQIDKRPTIQPAIGRNSDRQLDGSVTGNWPLGSFMFRNRTLYARSLAAVLREALSDTPVVCLAGPRQCGKTTLARVLEPERAFVSLDHPPFPDAASADPAGFIGSLRRHLTIDEIQRAPGLLPAINVARSLGLQRETVLEYVSVPRSPLPRPAPAPLAPQPRETTGEAAPPQRQRYPAARRRPDDGRAVQRTLDAVARSRPTSAAPPRNGPTPGVRRGS